MQKICVLCHYIGKGKTDRIEIISKTLWYGGWAIIAFFFGPKILIIAGMLFSLAAFSNFLKLSGEGNICPLCRNESLIPIENPRAQQIINEFNLAIPKQTSRDTNTEEYSQTN